MSVFNGSRYLIECVSSILGQTFGDFEFLIMDDASSDSTYEILKGLERSDKRIQIFRNKTNIGLTSSLNKLIENSRGHFIARIDADDTSCKERLQKQLDKMELESLDFVAACCRIVDEEGNELYPICPGRCDLVDLKWSLIFRNNIRHSTVMWRNRQSFRYDEAFKYAQDYEMWCRMIRKGFSLGIVCDMISDMRQRTDSLSASFGTTQDKLACEVTRRQTEYYLGRQVTDEEARNLRLVYLQKDGSQFEAFSKMGVQELRDAVRLYLEVADSFFRKELVDKNSMASMISSDLNSILREPHKNEMLIEIFKWVYLYQQNDKNEFASLVNENFLKTKEEGWRKKDPKLI
jgi:glycosyltransferase involved in cell wall biosynthesis